MTNLDSILKSRDISWPTKFHIVKAMVFPVVMYECESWTIKEGWVLKNWCFQIVVLEKTLESPLDSMEMKPVNPKGNQSWIFIGRTDAEVEAPITWPTDEKSWLIRKDSDAGKDLGQEEKRATEDNMVRCHYQLNGHEFEQTLGDSEGQGRLGAVVYGVMKSQTELSDWTTTTLRKLRSWHHFMAHRWGKNWKPWQILFSWAPKSQWTVTAATKLKDTCFLEEKVWQI